MLKRVQQLPQCLFGWALNVKTVQQGVMLAAVLFSVSLIVYLIAQVLGGLSGFIFNSICMGTAIVYAISLIFFLSYKHRSAGVLNTAHGALAIEPDCTETHINTTNADLLFSVAPIALVLIDTEGTIVQANNMTHSVFGFPDQTLLNKSIEILIPEGLSDHPHDHRMDNISEASHQEKIPKNKTVQGRKENGETFIACVSLIPTLFKDQKYVVLLIQDISERHAFEQSLKDEKSRAEKASQAKSEFVANMSHEIRTPLNAVLGSAQLLDNTSPSAIQKQYIQMIRSAGESLLAVINDILDFSKIESGQLEIVCSPFSLEEVITRVSVMMRMNIGEKPIIPVIDIDPNLPSHYHGDALRLQQVLINLVSNAIKFTQQGEVTLSIKSAKTPQTIPQNHIERSQDTESNETEKVLMHFSVSDSGIGIKPDQLQNLFKAFSQADASITRRFGGTGLGLVISNRIVGLMGSDIQVNSIYGQGTTFHFTIPLTPIDISETDVPSTALQPISGSETILIIEAHNASRQSILSIVNSRFNADRDDAKHQTIFYPSAQDYLDFIQAGKTLISPVDVAILNWESCQSESLLRKVIDILQNQNPTVRLLVSCASNKHEQTLLNLNELHYDNITVKPFTRFAFREQLFSKANSRPNAGLNSLATTLRSGIRVLLVEDTVLNQTIAEQMLEDMGATCDIANNGAEAIALYADHHDKYDIIFMDIQMPIMDGITATRLLRSEHHCTSPIIAMSAGLLDSERQVYLNSGMDDLVPKPVDYKALYQSLVQYANKHHQSPAPDTPHNIEPSNDLNPSLSKQIGFESDRLEILVNGKPDRIATLCNALQKICADASRRLRHSRNLLLKSDFDSLRFEMHGLKGLVANYGGMSLKPLFERVESCCNKESNASQSTDGAINQALDHVSIALEDYISDALGWCEQKNKTITSQDLTAQTTPSPVNADLLTAEIRAQLLEALDSEAFNEIKLLLEDIESLGGQAGKLAKK